MNTTPSSNTGDVPQWQRIKLIESPKTRWLLLGLLVVYIIITAFTLELDWNRIANGIPRAGRMFAGMIPPDMSRLQLMFNGILESVQMAVVGIVGAGGIGQTLAATFSRYDYNFSCTILLAIIALVFLGEILSSWIRSYLR
ncbi:MAG: hypothetical protein ABR512_03160 [Desulfopila sp.]